MDKILDKDGRQIQIGSFVKIRSNDIEDCIVVGFDGDRVDVVELREGFTSDPNEIEVVGELNG